MGGSVGGAGLISSLLRRAHEGRGGVLSLILSIVELVVGAAVAVAIAMQGYGAFEPWRSPLLLPAAQLVAHGLACLRDAAGIPIDAC